MIAWGAILSARVLLGLLEGMAPPIGMASGVNHRLPHESIELHGQVDVGYRSEAGLRGLIRSNV